MHDLGELNPNAVFMDVGSGLGIPNFYASPYVKLSLGIEIVRGRFDATLLILENIREKFTFSNLGFTHGDVYDCVNLV
jgi:hypothetical protein